MAPTFPPTPAGLSPKLRRFCFLTCLPIFLLTACKSGEKVGDDLAAQRNLTVRYAQRFRLSAAGAYTRLTVSVPVGDTSVAYTYTFTSDSTAADSPGVIRLPLRRMATLSTTHLGFLEALGRTDAVAAVADTAWVYTPSVLRRARAGLITPVGDGSSLRTETLLTLRPDAVMLSATGVPESDRHPKLADLGLRVILNADWLENHPLGRAEWVKVFGLLTGESRRADSLFAEVERRYLATAALAATATTKPKVLTGRNWRGTWYVPAGQSYMARLIADAGGDYFWAAEPGVGSLPLTFEKVLATANRADVWLNPDEHTSRTAMYTEENRYTLFRAYARDQVFNKTARTTPAGGNDFWEMAVVRPDLVLSDLLLICQPFVSPPHDFVFYRRLDP